MSCPTATPVLVCLKDVAPQPVRWLWPGRIALGKLSLLDGDPGHGKSLFTLDLCARLTQGLALPDGAPAGPPTNVLLVCEDDLCDTIRPRLEQLTGETGRVFAYRGLSAPAEKASDRIASAVPTSSPTCPEDPPLFPRDSTILRRLIEQTQSRLVVIDPLVNFLDAAVCNVHDGSIRQALQPLVQVAEATGAAILLVRHLTKYGSARALYRGSGSIAIIGAVRSAFLLAPDPEDPEVRVLACTKCNLGAEPPPLAFRIVPAAPHPRVEWLGKAELAANDLLARLPPGPLPREKARAFLQERLQQGPVEVDAVVKDALAEGISEKTLLRAKQELKIHARQVRRGNRPVFYWSLPGVELILDPLPNLGW